MDGERTVNTEGQSGSADPSYMNRMTAMMDNANILVLASMASQSHQSASNLVALDATEVPLDEAELSNGTLGSSSPMSVDAPDARCWY